MSVRSRIIPQPADHFSRDVLIIAEPDCDADNRLTPNTTGDTVTNFISGSLGPVVYVDWSDAGAEDGSAAHPYNTVTEGVYRAASGAAVRCRPWRNTTSIYR